MLSCSFFIKSMPGSLVSTGSLSTEISFDVATSVIYNLFKFHSLCPLSFFAEWQKKSQSLCACSHALDGGVNSCISSMARSVSSDYNPICAMHCDKDTQIEEDMLEVGLVMVKMEKSMLHIFCCEK